MLKLTNEQLVALRTAIDNKAEEALAEFDHDLNKVVDRITPAGWTLPSNVGIFAIKRLADETEIPDVNAFFEWYYTLEEYSHFKFMVNYINQSSIKAETKKLFLECWELFQYKLYAVYAIALLAVIEGILSEYSDEKKDIRMMMVCQKMVDTFPEDASKILKYTWISYSMFIRKIYAKSDFSAEEPEEINRHWLLHGRSDYDISEIDCIRLINAVRSLCMIYDTDNKCETE